VASEETDLIVAFTEIRLVRGLSSFVPVLSVRGLPAPSTSPGIGSSCKSGKGSEFRKGGEIRSQSPLCGLICSAPEPERAGLATLFQHGLRAGLSEARAILYNQDLIYLFRDGVGL
jgi:hypothetical protein